MKKYKTLLLAIGISVIAIGCGSKTQADKVPKEGIFEEKDSETANDDTNKAENVEAEAELDELEDTGENAQNADGVAGQGDDSSNKLYEEFIAGRAGISFDYYMNNVFKDAEYPSYVDEIIMQIPSNREYTVEELKQTLDENFPDEYEDGSVSFAEYSYLDCGADGKSELALRIGGSFVGAGSELTMIIKELNEKLQVVYAFTTWDRSYTAINEYGFICGDGSNGASNHGWDRAYIDPDGKYHFGYYEELEYDLESFAYFKEHDEYDLSALDGNISVYSLRLHEYEADNDPGPEYYTYEVTDSDTYEAMDVPNLYTDSKYKDVIDCFKEYNFVSMDEFNKVKDDQLKAIGVTDAIADGESLEFTLIPENGGDSSGSGAGENKDAEGGTSNAGDSESKANASSNAGDAESKGNGTSATGDNVTIASEGSIQKEIAEVEAKYQEYENLDWASMPQQPANITTYEMYTLWDDELNSIWSRLVEAVTPEKKAQLLADQRAWIKRKEAGVKAAGEEALGGTLQPQLENGTACRYTRKRVYYLASELAAAKGESFKIPSEVEESYADVDLSLDEVFQKFEGQWVFNERGSCIGVEKSSTCDYAPEGSTWTVWVTMGDTISDLDVMSYTDSTITFHKVFPSFDAYYMLRFNMEGSVQMAYGNSLDAMDDVVTAY